MSYVSICENIYAAIKIMFIYDVEITVGRGPPVVPEGFLGGPLLVPKRWVWGPLWSLKGF